MEIEERAVKKCSDGGCTYPPDIPMEAITFTPTRLPAKKLREKSPLMQNRHGQQHHHHHLALIDHSFRNTGGQGGGPTPFKVSVQEVEVAYV